MCIPSYNAPSETFSLKNAAKDVIATLLSAKALPNICSDDPQTKHLMYTVSITASLPTL